jgi:hypothetical protein
MLLVNSNSKKQEATIPLTLIFHPSYKIPLARDAFGPGPEACLPLATQ